MVNDRKDRRFNCFEKNRMTTSAPSSTMSYDEFVSIGKIPDYVRELPTFEGKANELMAWVMEVEKVLHMYARVPRDSTFFHIIEGTIRRKIKGEAAEVINTNGIAGDWSSIKSTLLLYYKDKRELKTLDHELTGISKKATEPLSSYFSRVNDLQSAIITQIYTDPKYSINAEAHASYFREKALDCFIRGLESPLCFLLKNNNPPNLNAAFNYCLEYCNMNMRSAPFKGETRSNQIPRPRDLYVPPPPRHSYHNNNVHQRPPLPPRSRNFQGNHYQQRNHFPTTTYNQPGPSQPRYNLPEHNLPLQQKIEYPQPMEVDPSLRSNAINYANRPVYDQKRAQSSPWQQKQTYSVDAPLEYVQTAPPLNETNLTSVTPAVRNEPETNFLDWSALW